MTISQIRSDPGTPLAALVRHAAMTPGKPAGHEKVQPPSVTRIIAVQEERGLKARAPHPADRRRFALTATAAGRDLARQVRMLRESRLTRRLGEQSVRERSALRATAPMLGKLSRS